MNVSIMRAATGAAVLLWLGCASSPEDGSEGQGTNGNVLPPSSSSPTPGAPTAGAPGTGTSVTPTTTTPTPTPSGMAGSGSAMPPVAQAGSGAVMPPLVTQDPVDPDITCYKFLTHGGTEGTPYHVGIANDAYFNFSFNAPWTGMQYARTFKTIVDNTTVLHHWLFFKEPAPVVDGAVAPSSGTHPGSELIHGWAPGGVNLELSADVGFEMPATGFTLELHYNSGDPSAEDVSGVEVCVTSPVRPTSRPSRGSAAT